MSTQRNYTSLQHKNKNTDAQLCKQNKHTDVSRRCAKVFTINSLCHDKRKIGNVSSIAQRAEDARMLLRWLYRRLEEERTAADGAVYLCV